ncbi:MAG: two-component regulator propeller domain-containing protein, partial [Bacteroidota bacterium]
MEHYRSGLRRLGWLAFLWGSLYGSVQLQAQVPELRFQHYSVREGLPNITINDLFQDQEGFLWIATWGGLSKYDGYSFTNYHYQPYDTTSLPANDVRCVIQNREGRLFLGLDGGLASYIPEEDQFVRMTPNEGHLKAFRLEDFGLDPSGKVWALFKYGQSKMLEIGPGWNLSWNQKVKAIGNCMIMRDSLMWVGQSGGYKETVQVWSIPQARKLSLESRYPALLALQHVGVTDFKLDRLNRVWIATEAGLYRFDPENESLVALGAIGTPVLNCLYVDRQDRVWVGSEVGLFCLSLEGELLKHYHNDPLDPLSLRDDLITAILVDASENLWVGTEGGGLHKASLATQKAFQTFTGSFFGVNHARLDVFTFAEGKEDRLWVGTNQGLFRLQKSSKQLREHITRRDYPALFSQKIKSLYESPEGLLLIGTDLGLNVLDLKTRRMRRAAGGQPSSASPPQLIRDIIPLTDENAYYLIGQPNRIYLPQSQTFQTLAHRAASQLKTSIHPQYAWQGHATQTGQVWIAENSGLLYWDYAKDSMALHNLGPAREIPERKAICLSPIGDSAFWVGTYGNGFYQIDWQGRVRQHFSEKDGLANNFVFGILPEGERYLWLSTNYGLVRFDREKGAFRTFHREDGLPDE